MIAKSKKIDMVRAIILIDKLFPTTKISSRLINGELWFENESPFGSVKMLSNIGEAKDIIRETNYKPLVGGTVVSEAEMVKALSDGKSVWWEE